MGTGKKNGFYYCIDNPAKYSMHFGSIVRHVKAYGKTSRHRSVMRDEVVKFLLPEKVEEKDGPVLILDSTLGGGGHSKALLEKMEMVFVLAVDRDPLALKRAASALEDSMSRCMLVRGNFVDMEKILRTREVQSFFRELGIDTKTEAPFSGIVADLGLSSDQLEDPMRGFSFLQSGPLDMRMCDADELRAHAIVNDYSTRELAGVFRAGGVGRDSLALAREISRRRPIEDTASLAQLCVRFYRKRIRGKAKKGSAIHPATLLFQAIRMAVNREIESLEGFLEQVPRLLKPGGRAVFISFQSLEDRAVTRSFRKWQRGEDLPPGFPASPPGTCIGKLLTPHPIRPSDDEILGNPRARSARMRVFEKLGSGETREV